ncbi:MAG: site-specific integrase [Bacteroidetes bacterium]|nr:site-specific integrase [Bacteroidota bacterium]
MTIKPVKSLKRIELRFRHFYRAEEEAEALKIFTFEAFEKKLFSKSNESQNVFYWYNSIIQKLNENKQFGTANNYEISSNSIKEFFEHDKGKKPSKIAFHDFTPTLLEKYESWMKEHKSSVTTVSIYLRTLRTIFNTAIDAEKLKRSYIHFGKRKYQIPASRNIKKALGKDILKSLFDASPRSNEEERAKDLFFFSYACNGMNTKDIAELKFENIKGDTLQFIRPKQPTLQKGNMKPTVIYLTDYTKSIIEKYSTKEQHPENYVFPFLSNSNTAFENFRKVKNLTTSINHSIKRLAKVAGITENISTYTARHSFATNAVRNGASMEFISEALNHSNMKTTQNYFAGFEEETKRGIAESLMNF